VASPHLVKSAKAMDPVPEDNSSLAFTSQDGL